MHSSHSIIEDSFVSNKGSVSDTNFYIYTVLHTQPVCKSNDYIDYTISKTILHFFKESKYAIIFNGISLKRQKTATFKMVT